MRHWKDRLGIVASVACAVHCALTPVLIAGLPMLQMTDWMSSPFFHQSAAIVCLLLVAVAIWPMVLRHRDIGVMTLSSVGLVLILVAAFILPDNCCSRVIGTPSGESFAADSSAVSLAGPTFLPMNNQSISSAMSLLQPWMTPFGGVMLVFAHALNSRRRGCGMPAGVCKCSQKASAAPNFRAEPEVVVLAKAS